MINFIFKNFWIKILCIIVASALWVYAVSGENKTDFFPGKIPISPRNVSKNLAPVYDQDEVQVKIMANSQSWRDLATDSFNAYVDLNNLSIGTHEVEIKVTSSVPGVKIIEQNPAKILVRMESVATKNIRVEAKINGSPADGFEVGDAVVRPIQVEARGAKSVIDDLTKATANINLDGDAASREEDIKLVALDLSDRPMRFISFSPEYVHIQLPIIKQSGGRMVGIRADISGSPESGFWISKILISPTTIMAVGDNEKLKALDFLETKNIDISGLSQTKEYVTTLKLPRGIEIATSEPRTIKVKVSISSVLSNREVIAGISYTGLAQGLRVASLEPKIIKVMVSGMFGILTTLNSDNVVANLELSGKKEGTYRIPVNSGSISTPPGTSIVSFLPSSVTVRIK
jgi:YbbR domain-containing protein